MRFSSLAFAVAVSVATSAAGQDIRYRTDYSVSLGALPIARASFLTEVNNENYKISANFRSSGLIDIISRISAESTVSGLLSGQRMQAQHYRLVYQTGRKTSVYDVSYQNGNVTKTVVEPPPKPRSASWIAVTDEDLKSVFDPITGLIVPDGEAVCPRTLPIYDGESRMDLIMTPKGTRSFTAGDVEGEAVVCGIRYVPKSGFRKGRKDIEYLRSVTGMEIWFAKTAQLKVYAPVYARVPTRMGTLYVTAVKFDG
ncbi:DUF3108 domain-containing protein [Rhizobium cremeum]|uniref:DUF3108 domain-containing protein n=1 Tax=Rhizobium cremeum TaxID=2813827 RepID=UPI000DDE862E|nr:DUF3108 domain-containing protein [Rhizobium cremeum]MCJ7994292.1 DUF3108 domain-containing protein [Rhizobium cremeum]MCJ7999791.1 DUF3108 domain-containing protein [Rhizobium cremeum]